MCLTPVKIRWPPKKRTETKLRGFSPSNLHRGFTSYRLSLPPEDKDQEVEGWGQERPKGLCEQVLGLGTQMYALTTRPWDWVSRAWPRPGGKAARETGHALQPHRGRNMVFRLLQVQTEPGALYPSASLLLHHPPRQGPTVGPSPTSDAPSGLEPRA